MKLIQSILKAQVFNFLTLVFSASFCSAQICDFHGKVLELEGQPTANIFGQSSSLEYIDQVLYLNQQAIVIDEVEEIGFESKGELEYSLGCSFFVGKDFNQSIEGQILSFNLDAIANENNIQKLDYITFHDYGRDFKFVLVNKAFLFEFVNAVSFVLKPATYYENDLVSAQSFDYVPLSEVSGSFEVTKEPVYETVTEINLVKDGYNILTVVPSEFETRHHFYSNESSTCPEAIVVEESIDFVSKEEHTELTVIDPQFETVSEQYLDVHAYYGPVYFKREQINLDTLKQVYTTKLEIESMKENCYNLNFINCANYKEIQDSVVETENLGLAYLPCPDIYKTAGEYCYNEEIEVPASYATRTFVKLVTPATVTTTTINAEYLTINRLIVSNKQLLDASCLIVEYDSIAYEKLVNPATIEDQEVPAEYGTLYSNKVKEYPEFSAVESQEDIISVMTDPLGSIKKIDHQLKLQTVDLSCMHDAIKSRLIELSFADTDVTIFSKEYYQAIIDFQQSKDLTIGAIDDILLESLNISFE